jgi:periplasmic copper chaperone A
MKNFRMACALVLAACGAPALWAQSVDVQNAWVRATVQGQMATGAFMTLSSKEGNKLVGVRAPVAGVAEVHEMAMDGGVMKMRALKSGLDLPAGKAVELRPGGFHVMLMDLKAPLKADTTVPLTLLFKNAKGVESQVEVKLPVRQTPPMSHGDGVHQ